MRLAQHRLPALASLLLLVVSLAWGASGVRAQEPWRLISQEGTFQFSQSLDFYLEVEAPATVTRVILFYGRAGEDIVRRVYPPFVAGRSPEVTYREPLERGQFAPGTRIRFWWRLQDASGTTFVTPVQTIDYVDATHPWQALNGDNVTLHHYSLRARAAEDLLAEAEASLTKIRQEIGVDVARRVDIYIYRNETDMREAFATRSDDFDARVTTLGVAVDEDTLILLGSHPDVALTMAHELSHIVVGLATDNPYTRLPRWLDEGLAMLAEGELPRHNSLALQRGITNDDLLSVRSMTSYSGRVDQVDLFYGEAYSVVNYLIETYGLEQMIRLLEAFSRGSTQDDALQYAYGIDLDDLDARWRESLGLGPRGQRGPLQRIPALAALLDVG